ncbi:MAG: hypothetical protein RMM51_06365 [Verrucomicrobiae bacterium]|nr:hypothetical protein [Verrucomicrobiae bacterium]
MIAIIAALAALLLPSLQRARGRAKIANCVSNLRQVGLAGAAYTQDYNEWIVPNFGNSTYASVDGFWPVKLCRYLGGSVGVYSCPAMNRSILVYQSSGVMTCEWKGIWLAYGANMTIGGDIASGGALPPTKLTALTRPSDTVWITDSRHVNIDYLTADFGSAGQRCQYWHDGMIQILLFDGRVVTDQSPISHLSGKYRWWP